MGEERKLYKVLVVKPEGNRPLLLNYMPRGNFFGMECPDVMLLTGGNGRA
jgi:hypothetical protein